MARTAFYQKLLGRRLTEDARFTDRASYSFMENRTFKYYGLQGPSVEIVAVFHDSDGLKVTVVDQTGKLYDLWPNLFILEPEAKEG